MPEPNQKHQSQLMKTWSYSSFLSKLCPIHRVMWPSFSPEWFWIIDLCESKWKKSKLRVFPGSYSPVTPPTHHHRHGGSLAVKTFREQKQRKITSILLTVSQHHILLWINVQPWVQTVSTVRRSQNQLNLWLTTAHNHCSNITQQEDVINSTYVECSGEGFDMERRRRNYYY